MRADLITPDAPQWRAALEHAPHDVYHLPEYALVSGIADGGAPLALDVRGTSGSMLVPLLRRPIPGADAFDFTSPYGYSAPLVRAEDSTAFLREAIPAVIASLRAARGVSLFVRLHPILTLPNEPFSAAGAVVSHGPTVSIDLKLPYEEAFARMRATHRNEVRRALRSGHRAVHDEGFERYDRFRELYHATMRRLGATDYYDFNDAYFDALRTTLRPWTHLWHVEVEGEIAASALFFECNGIVQYHLSAADPKWAKHQPTKLLLSSVHEWGAKRGLDVLHLGGGVGSDEDSLFFFKAGFSDRRHTFCTWRAVLDADVFAELTKARAPGHDPRDLSAFFPPYRRSVAPTSGVVESQ